MTVRGSSANGTSISPASVNSAGTVVGVGLGTTTQTRTTTITLGNGSAGTNLVDATSGNVVINFNSASSCTGLIFTVKKIDASVNTVTIDPNAAETIDGAATKVLSTQWSSVMIQSNGTAWFILAAF